MQVHLFSGFSEKKWKINKCIKCVYVCVYVCMYLCLCVACVFVGGVILTRVEERLGIFLEKKLV